MEGDLKGPEVPLPSGGGDVSVSARDVSVDVSAPSVDVGGKGSEASADVLASLPSASGDGTLLSAIGGVTLPSVRSVSAGYANRRELLSLYSIVVRVFYTGCLHCSTINIFVLRFASFCPFWGVLLNPNAGP